MATQALEPGRAPDADVSEVQTSIRQHIINNKARVVVDAQSDADHALIRTLVLATA